MMFSLNSAIMLTSGGLLLLGIAAVAHNSPSVDVSAPFSQAFAIVGPLLTSSPATPSAAVLAADHLHGSSGSFAELRAKAQALELGGTPYSAAIEFFRAADKALAVGREDVHAALMAEYGRVSLSIGDLRSAKWALELADERLRATGQEDSRPAVWLLRGDEAKAAGRYADSTGLIQKALTYFEKVGDLDGVARASAAECDLLQLQRELEPASKACARALALQPVGHPDRPLTEKAAGLTAFFHNDLQRAVGLHMSAHKGFRAQGREDDAFWMRELILDDQAGVLEAAQGPADVYTPLVNELVQLVARLEAAPEVLWWRVSDARLRLADMQRKQQKYGEAEQNLQLSVSAFQRRPLGFEEVPDYATLFEFAGLLARDRGDLLGAQAALGKAKAVLERIVGPANTDVHMLEQEILALGAAIEA